MVAKLCWRGSRDVGETSVGNDDDQAKIGKIVMIGQRLVRKG